MKNLQSSQVSQANQILQEDVQTDPASTSGSATRFAAIATSVLQMGSPLMGWKSGIRRKLCFFGTGG